MHLSPQVAQAVVHSKAVVMLMLIYCFMYLPLFVGAPCWSLLWYCIIALQSSWQGRQSFFLCFTCLSNVLLVVMMCASSSRCHVLFVVCECGISWSYSLSFWNLTFLIPQNRPNKLEGHAGTRAGMGEGRVGRQAVRQIFTSNKLGTFLMRTTWLGDVLFTILTWVRILLRRNAIKIWIWIWIWIYTLQGLSALMQRERAGMIASPNDGRLSWSRQLYLRAQSCRPNGSSRW